MDLQSSFMELEESAQRISDGLAAIRIMVVGLDGSGSEYTGAFHAVWRCLSDAEQELRGRLDACQRLL